MHGPFTMKRQELDCLGADRRLTELKLAQEATVTTLDVCGRHVKRLVA